MSALLPGVSSCQAAASEGRCEEMNSGVAFLCQQSCASTFDGACDDQDAAVALAWEAGLSHTLGVQVGMNCARTRAALQCNTEPFASLCPATCLRCIDNKLAGKIDCHTARTCVCVCPVVCCRVVLRSVCAVVLYCVVCRSVCVPATCVLSHPLPFPLLTPIRFPCARSRVRW